MEPMFTKTAEELKVEQLLQRIYTAYEAYDGVDNTELNRAMADAANACATFLEMKSLCLGLQNQGVACGRSHTMNRIIHTR